MKGGAILRNKLQASPRGRLLHGPHRKQLTQKQDEGLSGFPPAPALPRYSLPLSDHHHLGRLVGRSAMSLRKKFNHRTVFREK